MRTSIFLLPLLGFSSCVPASLNSGYPGYPGVIACAAEPGDAEPIHLTFDATSIGAQVRIYDRGVLVIDTCASSPLQTDFPYYSLNQGAGTNDREIEIDLGDKRLPIEGVFVLEDGSDCVTPFQSFGTALVTYDYKYSTTPGASACSAPVVSDDERILFQ